ncbi:MAG TPA: biliverdin-producing heme oxygenase [Gemmatimonadales bacterium]|nr:biliverdin-producing heme oxygenase [Gemmatimonadales bacterium]
MADTLSTRLRRETKEAHSRAERSGIMRALLARRMERSAYIALLANLLPVYTALEAGLRRHQGHPAVRPIHHEALFRVPALTQDLATLAGPDWSGSVGTVPPAIEYAERIEAAEAAPWLLVAHSYTRYLGDLSGGQILKRLIQEQLGPEGARATAFYEFPGIPDPTEFKEGYRAALDALPLAEAQQDEIVAEALRAFDLNARLFEALD